MGMDSLSNVCAFDVWHGSYLVSAAKRICSAECVWNGAVIPTNRWLTRTDLADSSMIHPFSQVLTPASESSDLSNEACQCALGIVERQPSIRAS